MEELLHKLLWGVATPSPEAIIVGKPATLEHESIHRLPRPQIIKLKELAQEVAP